MTHSNYLFNGKNARENNATTDRDNNALLSLFPPY